MRAGKRIRIAITVASAASVLLPASALAGFSTQLVEVTGALPRGNTTVSDVGMAPDGTAFVAWSEGDATNVVAKVRRVGPDGTLGPTLTISDGTQKAFQPTLAVASDGRALVAWSERVTTGPASLRGRWIAADGSLGPQFTIRNGGVASDSGELAAAPTSTGGAIVAWHNFVSNPPPFRRVEARRVNPDNSVGGLIFPTSGAGSVRVRVQPDTAGGALFAWREAGEVAQHVDALDVPGPLQAPITASASAELATDGHDHFQLLYRKGSPGSLEYRALDVNGVAGTEQTIDPASQAAGYTLDTNSQGHSVALWAKPLSISETTISARLIGADGIPEPTTQSQVIPGGHGSIAGGIDNSDRVPIAWTQGDPDDAIFGRVLSAETATDPARLSTTTGVADGPHVAVSDSGFGIAAWTETIDPATFTQARVYLRQILPPPSCGIVSATVVQGRPTEIPLGCTGVQLEAPQVVDGPGHGTLDSPDPATQSVVYTPDAGFDGTDTFTFAGVNRGGPGATLTATIQVGADTVKPKIKRFKLSPKPVTFRPSAAKPRKPKFKLRYSEPATATIVIERRNQCPKRARAAKCRKFERVGKLRARRADDSAAVKLRPKLGKHRLGSGRFRATAVATDPAGNRSRPKRLTFSVRP